MTESFAYEKAFSRTVGWVTGPELGLLRASCVAIAGLGGVGGVHALTLARLGIGNFKLADFDEFAIHNMNRQAGAFMSTLELPKLGVLERMVTDINPEAVVQSFATGVTPENVDEFLKGVSVYVDALDLFALPARRMVFARCRELGIPALTAAPLGMGVAFLHFSPSGMSFEEYFKLDGHDIDEQYARFIAGVSPAMLNRKYLVAPEAVNFKERRGPSTPMACDLCAGVMGTEVLKVILGRGRIRSAPWAMQFDAYRQKLSWTWRPFGNANPLQQLLLHFIRPILQGRG